MRLKVEVDCSDGLVRRIVLGLMRAAGGRGVSISGMQTAPRVATGGSAQDAPTVLARIDAEQTPLVAALDAWGADMARRGKRPKSIKSFRDSIEEPAEALGWTTVDAITYDAVTAWLAQNQSSGRWQGNTADGHLSAFRSFTKFLCVSRRIERDPLYGACGTGEEDGPGARAATTEETRTLLDLTTIREQTDRRAAKAYPLLHRAILALAGCRFSEPAGAESGGPKRIPRGWQWGDLRLEESIPVIMWTPMMQKNKGYATLPLYPALADMLRRHRENVPHKPTDPVFPKRPTRAGLRADVDRCGFTDSFSAHSLRKWFRTSLAEANVQADLVNILVRHADLAGRYTKPSQVVLLQALRTLPGVLPITVDERILGEMNPKSLDNGGEVADTENATLTIGTGPRKILTERPQRNSRTPNVSQPRGSTSGALGPSFPVGRRPKRAKESSQQLTSQMPSVKLLTGVDSIADWLVATADLLRCVGHERNNEQGG